MHIEARLESVRGFVRAHVSFISDAEIRLDFLLSRLGLVASVVYGAEKFDLLAVEGELLRLEKARLTLLVEQRDNVNPLFALYLCFGLGAHLRV